MSVYYFKFSNYIGAEGHEYVEIKVLDTSEKLARKRLRNCVKQHKQDEYYDTIPIRISEAVYNNGYFRMKLIPNNPGMSYLEVNEVD